MNIGISLIAVQIAFNNSIMLVLQIYNAIALFTKTSKKRCNFYLYSQLWIFKIPNKMKSQLSSLFSHKYSMNADFRQLLKSKTGCSPGFYFLEFHIFLIAVGVYDYQNNGYRLLSCSHGYHL